MLATDLPQATGFSFKRMSIMMQRSSQSYPKRGDRMTKPTLVLIAAFGFLTTVGGVGSAHASTMMVTQTFTNPAQMVPFTYTAMASQFNPSMGTLVSVEITMTSDITGFVSVVNINPVSEAFTNATSSVPVGLTGPAGLALGVTATTSAQSGTVAANTTNPPLNLPGNTVIASESTTITSALGLAPYIGTGTNNLPFVFSAGTGTYGGSAVFGVFFGGTATADANIKVIYTYNTPAVPEPSSMALLGIGMAGFLGFRRLLKRKAVA
jgi:hypothetical protein